MNLQLTNEEISQMVLDESQKLQTIINENLLYKFAKLHNISSEYNHFFAKQEMVASRAYFPGPKKKYALEIINLKGVPVQEAERKGLITQRSDYSALTKERIGQILDLLVKHDKVDFKEIKRVIEETREELLALIIQGSKTIARPVSFKKDLDDYKGLPQHIKAMNLWNSLEYDHFHMGIRGYLFRIDGIDPYQAPPHIVEKLSKVDVGNCIAIPAEMEFLPSYYKIDVESSIAFSWDDRVLELLQPVANRVYNRKKEINEIMTW